MPETRDVTGGRIPPCRGALNCGRPLSELTWMRVGGPAEWLFQPADIDDLAEFLGRLDRGVPLFVMGVGSNLIVRDGGIAGVVVRLGRPFSGVEIAAPLVRAGAAALDSRVAQTAARAGLDLTFLRTIPGTVGGAVRMNAGCYGSYIADVCREITLVTRCGQVKSISAAEAGFGYRSSAVPDGAVIVEAVFECHPSPPEELEARMAAQIEFRNDSQPAKARTAGSTFRNPAGYSSTGSPDDTHELKAWKLIDNAGMRGLRRGAAAVSELHPNFLVNLGGATATEIETLGEEVRRRVREDSGIQLEWEIIRVGAGFLGTKDPQD